MRTVSDNDLRNLERLIGTMKPRSKAYEIVKAEMRRRGHWKNKPRGVPMRKGHDSRRSRDGIWLELAGTTCRLDTLGNCQHVTADENGMAQVPEGTHYVSGARVHKG